MCFAPSITSMLLHIHNNLFIEDIQDHFSECFPWLKIEFYKNPLHWKNGSSEKDRIDPKTKIGDISRNHKVGILQIKSTDTVAHVENCLKTLFDLNVRVFRKENSCWIQATATDNYTLMNKVIKSHEI